MNPIIGLMLNYRDAERSHRCITSMLADGIDAVFVWDNSEDGGVSAQALQQHWQNEARVVIEVSTHNLGFANGVNRAIQSIVSFWPNAWVMLINNDALLLPGALQSLAQALTNHPAAAIAYPRVDHGGRVYGTAYYQRYFALQQFKNSPWPGSFAYPSGSALLIALERIEAPLFDEDFFMYGEDVMLGWRLGAEGMIHVPQVLVWHEGSASSHNGSAFYENRVVAGHWLLARKLCREPAEYPLLLAGRLISLPARAIIRALRGRSLLPIKSLWQSWRLAHGHDALLPKNR